MDKLFNYFSMLIGSVGGVLIYVFGGGDMLLKTIVTLVVLDYLTGILKAIYDKKLSSEIGFKGIIKKVMMFLVIATAVRIQIVLGNTLPLREIVITFFIANEALSLLENASAIIPVPDALKRLLLQLKSDTINKVESGDKNEN